MTEKLYYKDSHLYSFDAPVLSCTPLEGGRYAVVLSRTAFFPEGGGQYSDKGILGGIQVLDVQEKDGEIIHTLSGPLTVGEVVHGEIDVADRFRKMQNHSGEHIVSGLIHNLYGLENVGFHLGSEDVTIDLNGVLTREQLMVVEKLANEAIYKNLDILCEFPAPEVLSTLVYRSKLELTENVRIVTVPGIDVCACCAPHVYKTGEIGIIKLLDFAKYKGGIRIHMLCGSDALCDYELKYKNVTAIGNSLSAKSGEVAEAVARLSGELAEKKAEITRLSEEIVKLKAEAIPMTEGNLILFTDLDPVSCRKFAELLTAKVSGIAGVFSGSDDAGYKFVLASKSVDLKKSSKEIVTALAGRGGGQSTMISGSASAPMAQIKEYFGV